NFETVSYTNSYWIPSSASHWETVTINDITANHQASNFRYKFVFESDGGNNLFIDDINIFNANTVGITDLDISNTISVFPNPAQDHLSRNIMGNSPYTFDLQLLHSVGHSVWSSDQLQFGRGSQLMAIDTGDLGPGG